MLPFRVTLKPQHRFAASPRPASSLRNLCSLRDSALDSSYLLSLNSVASSRSYSTTSIQPLSFQTFTHSSAQRQSCISISSNRFRTLSIATKGIPPLFPFWNSSPSLSLPHYAPYFQALPRDPFCKPFLLMFIHVMGGVPSTRHSNAQTSGRFDVFPSDLLSFHILAHSYAHTKNSSLLFSTASALFVKKHPGWGYLRSPRSTLSEATTTLRTSHQSPLWPSVPLQPNVLGATIGIGTRNLQDPGKQLRSPRCLRLESGHREPFDHVPGRRPRCGRGCKSCLGPAF